MKQCPYCKADIPSDALKCRYCGEWVERPPRATDEADGEDNSLGRAANRYVSYQMVWGVIGLILFLIIFFVVFLPILRQTSRGFLPTRGMPFHDTSFHIGR